MDRNYFEETSHKCFRLILLAEDSILPGIFLFLANVCDSRILTRSLCIFKPRPNALDFSLYIARQMSSIVECCREGVAKRSRLFTRLGTQHSTDVLFDE